MGLKHILWYASLAIPAIAKLRAPIAHKDAADSKQFAKKNKAMLYSFDNIGASLDIYWQPCFKGFLCTKLLVPRDYADPKQGYTSIAYIKYKSSNGTGQDILYNPG